MVRPSVIAAINSDLAAARERAAHTRDGMIKAGVPPLEAERLTDQMIKSLSQHVAALIDDGYRYRRESENPPPVGSLPANVLRCYADQLTSAVADPRFTAMLWTAIDRCQREHRDSLNVRVEDV